MPSFGGLIKASVSLASLTSSRPESVAVTGSSGDQLLGYFSGWTSTLTIQGSVGLPSATWLTPMTVFNSTGETVSCQWVKDQVKLYTEADDVFEESFMKCKEQSFCRMSYHVNLISE